MYAVLIGVCSVLAIVQGRDRNIMYAVLIGVCSVLAIVQGRDRNIQRIDRGL